MTDEFRNNKGLDAKNIANIWLKVNKYKIIMHL